MFLGLACPVNASRPSYTSTGMGRTLSSSEHLPKRSRTTSDLPDLQPTESFIRRAHAAQRAASDRFRADSLPSGGAPPVSTPVEKFDTGSTLSFDDVCVGLSAALQRAAEAAPIPNTSDSESSDEHSSDASVSQESEGWREGGEPLRLDGLRGALALARETRRLDGRLKMHVAEAGGDERERACSSKELTKEVF